MEEGLVPGIWFFPSALLCRISRPFEQEE